MTTFYLLLAFLAATTCSVSAGTRSTLSRRDWTIGASATGRLTYYGDGYKTLQGGSDPPPLGPQNGGWYGACYNQFWATTGPLIPKNFNRFAALNSAQFQLIGPSVVCGTCLMITYPTLGTKTMVQIVDSCPGCPVNGVDVAHSAFARLFDSPALPGIDTWTEAETVGALPAVTWQVVSCDTLVADTTFLVDKVAADAVIAAKALLAGRKLRRADGAEGEL